MIILAMKDKRWPMLPWYGLVTSPCWIPPSCYQSQPVHLWRWLDPVRIPEYWKEFPFSHPNKNWKFLAICLWALAGQKNHLEKPNAWKVWSLKGPLSCSKSKKAKGWVWHLSYWTSDFRLFIFDIKHLNLTQPNLEKKTKQRMNNSLERNGEIEAPWFWEKYFSL